ncbi:MAG: methylenetetrahydrofolate--tRNA-(uracil(54)-C(5))-methyltransferase (FADH(2)-oxidizing) TrmFO [Bacillota bacterium]|nr:methylenetetrahydrofolate--tRNA-(uracil(54)-C(5))-methyltransferase (FADH(2)-oxidizing) TrmFO [Bacillota bacterium]
MLDPGVGDVMVVGGGLAGIEAAWQAARQGLQVTLVEMRPAMMTPAHTTGDFAELVCSNSLGSDSPDSAAGVLKEEMRILGSIIMRCAEGSRIPAGSALACDRRRFARLVTAYIERCPRVKTVRKEVHTIPEGVPVVIATGPLTSESLAQDMARLAGTAHLYFYDAVAPIVTAESCDMSKAFWGSRYGRGGDDYLNCPMTKEEYDRFCDALVSARCAPVHGFEDTRVFEACMPVEVLARRGREALAYGPMRPVGLVDPRTGERPYAVVQLRREDEAGTLLNMVGFQTRLTWDEQRRVFRMIPGLEHAEFVRYGVMHRNTYINSPELLRPTLQFRSRDTLFFAGQVTGVEGYLESAASGLVAGVNVARLARGHDPLVFPAETVHGSLCRYITGPRRGPFQPMNANFGIMPRPEGKLRGKAARRQIATSALNAMRNFEKTLRSGLEELL